MLRNSSLWCLYCRHSLGTVQDHLYCSCNCLSWSCHPDRFCFTWCHWEKECRRCICCGNDSHRFWCVIIQVLFFLWAYGTKGTGLFKSNISPLIAEQYRRTKSFVITTGSGERVIVDPALTVSRMYMVSIPAFLILLQTCFDRLRFQYFYLFINIGAVIGQVSMTYAEKVRSDFKFVTIRVLTLACSLSASTLLTPCRLLSSSYVHLSFGSDETAITALHLPDLYCLQRCACGSVPPVAGGVSILLRPIETCRPMISGRM